MPCAHATNPLKINGTRATAVAHCGVPAVGGPTWRAMVSRANRSCSSATMRRASSTSEMSTASGLPSARGSLDADRLRDTLVAHRPADWPAIFAVDAGSWPRCDAETSPERGFYYHPSRHSNGQPIVAGWSYQWITQLSWSADSWTAPLDARRIPPTADTTPTTVAQVPKVSGHAPLGFRFGSRAGR